MNDRCPIFTTRQGQPANDDDPSLLSKNERGAAAPENRQCVENTTHLGRGRIPECVLHARGAGAHGYFEPYGKIGDEPVPESTCAEVLNGVGVPAPTLVHFPAAIYPLQARRAKVDACDGNDPNERNAARAAGEKHTAMQRQAFIRRRRET